MARGFRKGSLIPIVVALVAAFAGFKYTTTTSGGEVGADRKQVMTVSAEEMVESANQSYAQIIAQAKREGKLNTNAETTKRVKKIASALIKQTGNFREDALGWDWQVNVITESTVNAWCMAGGKIVVYTGIIDTLKLTDAQLAAVIGHEISHALREHSREQVSRSKIKSLGTAAVAEAFGLNSTERGIVNLAAEALSLKYSRNQETEADNMGTELMARAGYNPNEAVKVWEKMSSLSKSSTPEFMSTHPSHESRIENLHGIAETVYPLYQKAIK